MTKYCHTFDIEIVLKKISSISILLVVLLQVFYSNICMWQINAIKENRWEYNEEATLINLTIPLTQIQNKQARIVDNGKEIILNNEMYDIVKLNYKNNHEISFTVKHDKHESKIAQAQKKNIKKILKQSLASVYIIPEFIKIKNKTTYYFQAKAIETKNKYNSYKSSVQIPPPKV